MTTYVGNKISEDVLAYEENIVKITSGLKNREEGDSKLCIRNKIGTDQNGLLGVLYLF